MTREEAEKKAYERYPDDLGPCDKPSIYDDARTLHIQREAYIAGLLEGSSEKPNSPVDSEEEYESLRYAEFKKIDEQCFNEDIVGWARELLIARNFYELGRNAK